MKLTINHIFLGVSMLAFAACEPKIEVPTPGTGGGVNLTNYVAIGNSLTAGYADGGLYLEGQKVAYPVIMAEQFKLAGGGDFYAPLYEASQANGLGYKQLIGFTATGSPIIVDVPASPAAIKERNANAYDAIGNPDSIVLQPFTGPNNNMGVPGIRVLDMETPGYGIKNPYFGRILSAAEYASFTTYSQKILSTNPTFFTCWLGNNDVLGYSTAGGYPDLGKTTDVNTFTTNYNTFIDQLLATPNAPKGVVANIPDVTSLPFFTTIGASVKPALTAAGAPAFLEYELDSSLLTVIAPRLIGRSPIWDTTKLRPNPVSRIATYNSLTKTYDGDVFFTLTFAPYAGDLGKPSGKAWKALFTQLLKSFGPTLAAQGLTLTINDLLNPLVSGIDTLKPFGVHPRNPVPDVFVLNGAETARARAATLAFNEVIKGAVDRHANKLAFVDANAFLRSANAGLVYDGIGTNSNFISGGIFSVDGVHLTPRGNAIGANEFISAINKKFGSTIPLVNVGKYRGVRLP